MSKHWKVTAILLILKMGFWSTEAAEVQSKQPKLLFSKTKKKEDASALLSAIATTTEIYNNIL